MRKSITGLLLLGLVQLFGGEFIIDDSHSRVGFSIKHMMISNVQGEFKQYEGDIIFDEKAYKFEKLTATVNVASVDTGIEKRDNHLRSADFFDSEKYPEITFAMKSYKGDKEEGVVEGDLTIHGITKPVTMKVEIGGVAVDPWGNTRLGFAMTGKINRKDFDLKWNKAMEAGGFVVGEEVKLNIEIEAMLM